jgi:hypothetical protein
MLINKSQVQKRALYFGSLRAWKPTRVSKTFLQRFEAEVDVLLRNMINVHPSKGKTVQ